MITITMITHQMGGGALNLRFFRWWDLVDERRTLVTPDGAMPVCLG
jgi:hypothetical protein